MVSFKDNLSINLDITKTCTLQCPACFRQNDNFKNLKSIYSDMPIEDFIKVSNYFKHIEFCGTIGDPIFHPKFIDMLEITSNKNISVKIANSASHKSRKWYLEAFKANPSALWVFGIDGLPSESHKYRKNQDGEKLFEVMLEAQKMGVKVEWQYLIFNYNETSIKQSKILADKHNLKLNIFKTKRHGSLVPSQKHINYIDDQKTQKISPRCLNGRDLGHSAMGYITPCCWFGDVNVEKKYPKLCNETTKISNINTIEEIFNTPGWKEYEQILINAQNKAFKMCWDKCGKVNNKSKILYEA